MAFEAAPTKESAVPLCRTTIQVALPGTVACLRCTSDARGLFLSFSDEREAAAWEQRAVWIDARSETRRPASPSRGLSRARSNSRANIGLRS